MGAPRVIPAGEVYERLTVRRQRNPGDPYVECVCTCGRECDVPLNNWQRTRSCGCLRIEQVVARSTSHGHAGTSIYGSWSDMVNRCKNRSHPRWADYGGRGISVCERWRTFANFLADMGERPEGLTLDRIDNDGNYEPGNCRWATLSEQRTNRRPQRLKPACKNGHPYPNDPPRARSGKRRCLLCERNWAREARERRRVAA